MPETYKRAPYMPLRETRRCWRWRGPTPKYYGHRRLEWRIFLSWTAAKQGPSEENEVSRVNRVPELIPTVFLERHLANNWPSQLSLQGLDQRKALLMADFSHEISVDDAIGAATSTQSPSAQALSRVRTSAERIRSGFPDESVLNILKLIFAGAPLPEVLTIIARLVEAQGKGMYCTIWLLDREGKYVRCATAAKFTWIYCPLGPHARWPGWRVLWHRCLPQRAGLCDRHSQRDPLWDSYRHLVEPYGVRAVWARPLFSSEGKALGTFAILYREVGSPSATDLQLIENASHIVGIAIERHINEERIAAQRSISRRGPTPSALPAAFPGDGTRTEITFSEELYRIFEFDYDAPVTLEQIVGRVHPEDIPLLSEEDGFGAKEH